MEKNFNTHQLLDSRVSAVIPNYNGQHLLKKFLPSVLSSLRDGDELVIVDDLSTDHSISWLIKEFKLKLTKKSFYKDEVPKNYNPNMRKLKFKLYVNQIVVNDSNSKSRESRKRITITLIAQMVNLRFAGAANVGVAIAKNHRIFLLNSDVKATGGVVDQLLNHFLDDKVFGVGCLEYERDSSGDKSGKNILKFSRGLFWHSKANDFKSGKSAWVSGGSGMFDKCKWMELRGFDKLFYPAYWEDIDLSFRARKRGWKVLFDEKAVVYHVHESTNIDAFGKEKIEIMSLNNSDKFAMKNGNLLQKILFLLYKPYWSYKRKRTKIARM